VTDFVAPTTEVRRQLRSNMDIDRFIAQNQPAWDRLEQLCNAARRSARRISGDELDEMVALYQRTSAHLAHARTTFDDVALVTRLSRLVGVARGTIYRTRTRPGRAVGMFFTSTFPAAVWQSRRAIGIAAFLLLAPALAMGIWLGTSANVRKAAIDPHLQKALATHDFAQYYRSQAAAGFETQVTFNNIGVAFEAFASGVLVGVPTAGVLIDNGANVGVDAAVMHAYHKDSLFWGLILPHGLLELTSVAVAGGAGFMLAWAIIAPGERTRAQALAREGLRSVTILGGLVVTFAVAGFTEAWVTPSGLPTWARVGIGILWEVLFISYVVGFGRNAAAQGVTGALGESSPDDIGRPLQPTS
jgi:uncharacterized membrane protein SpoIIM required for sporulation